MGLPSLTNLSSSKVNVRFGCAKTVNPNRLIMHSKDEAFHRILHALASSLCSDHSMSIDLVNVNHMLATV